MFTLGCGGAAQEVQSEGVIERGTLGMIRSRGRLQSTRYCRLTRSSGCRMGVGEPAEISKVIKIVGFVLGMVRQWRRGEVGKVVEIGLRSGSRRRLGIRR